MMQAHETLEPHDRRGMKRAQEWQACQDQSSFTRIESSSSNLLLNELFCHSAVLLFVWCSHFTSTNQSTSRPTCVRCSHKHQLSNSLERKRERSCMARVTHRDACMSSLSRPPLSPAVCTTALLLPVSSRASWSSCSSSLHCAGDGVCVWMRWKRTAAGQKAAWRRRTSARSQWSSWTRPVFPSSSVFLSLSAPQSVPASVSAYLVLDGFPHHWHCCRCSCGFLFGSRVPLLTYNASSKQRILTTLVTSKCYEQQWKG